MLFSESIATASRSLKRPTSETQLSDINVRIPVLLSTLIRAPSRPSRSHPASSSATIISPSELIAIPATSSKLISEDIELSEINVCSPVTGFTYR